MLTKDVLSLIALELDLETLLKFQGASKYLAHVCDFYFWTNKINKDFGLSYNQYVRDNFNRFVTYKVTLANFTKWSPQEYYQDIDNHLSHESIFDFIKLDRLDLVKAYVYIGGSIACSLEIPTVINERNFTPIMQAALEKKETIFEFLSGQLNSKDVYIFILSNLIKQSNCLSNNDKYLVFVKYFDIILPQAVKFEEFRKHKNFWKAICQKLEEFNNLRPDIFGDVYQRKIEFYRKQL